MFIPDAETQILFNESIKTSCTLSFGSWSTDRKTVDAQLEKQAYIGWAQNINSSKYLIVAHQTAARKGVPNKANTVVVFDILDVRKYHVDIDGVRYPRDCVNIDYWLNDYTDQDCDLKSFCKAYVGEELLNLLNILIWKMIIQFKSLILDFGLIILNLKKSSVWKI